MLRAARIDAGMSQDQAADQLGWSRDKLADIETATGKCELGEVYILADLYKVPRDKMTRRIEAYA
jgi:DNA-binding XRE family transcriptional regulator